MVGPRMNLAAQLSLSSALIVAGALLGGWLALHLGKNRPLVIFLALAAGVMFGAAFFHMLPEAFHGGGYMIFTWVPLGFAFLFLLERYVLVHACEEPPGCTEHGTTGGLAAFWGLSLHTLFDGVALASATVEGVGTVALVAILAHKIPSSFSLAALLASEHKTRTRILVYCALFGMMVPAGAVLYLGLDEIVKFTSLAPAALAFSAGSFLYIAVSDLLPHVNRHGRERRLGTLAAMAIGLLVMYLLTFITGHDHSV
jgi:zinc and cadmium transporter